jgi:aryl-alcohol dehydrogenase-like predicted oxidoreductase
MGPGMNQKGLSRKHIMEGVDASLKRLGTDYIDLLIIHRLDPNTGMEEICNALDDVVRAGKALYLGASSMAAWQMMKLLGIQRAKGYAPFVSMQNFYNLIYREEEREMMPLCASEGLAVTPWSKATNETTVRGRTDTIGDMLKIGASREDEAIRQRVAQVAEKLGVKPAIVAMAWVMSKPFVTAPIIGASKPSHIDDAIAALNLKLDSKAIEKLEAPYRPKPVVGF